MNGLAMPGEPANDEPKLLFGILVRPGAPEGERILRRADHLSTHQVLLELEMARTQLLAQLVIDEVTQRAQGMRVAGGGLVVPRRG
jgi:hypothetical protein